MRGMVGGWKRNVCKNKRATIKLESEKRAHNAIGCYIGHESIYL